MNWLMDVINNWRHRRIIVKRIAMINSVYGMKGC
jgi:hypothetical protein